jgi:hypothetical protein
MQLETTWMVAPECSALLTLLRPPNVADASGHLSWSLKHSGMRPPRDLLQHTFIANLEAEYRNYWRPCGAVQPSGYKSATLSCSCMQEYLRPQSPPH